MGARIVTSDSEGNIVSIGFDGSVRRFPTGPFSPDHYFIYDDLNLDGKSDFIFLDGDSLSVFDPAAKKIFAHKFHHKIGLAPELFTLADKSRKIGIVDSSENRIYLFNADGTLFRGFPLDGNSRFAVGLSGSQNDQFNLITGTSDGYINNYLIK
jgi:hypothetical protein